ncbi:hypothetical protein CY34DRAFT_17283 [Suillus luteus UH-Slu-Lm8-n1]|uniref:Uncharacterized protein n=1 Tax=Suillus luteus UH-Slu-Lm8-n1 TaxID=930992 RepID=A0A0C9ZZY0_9AGAM|nr:hypothetical protein CY34DRAFT_17283 [Suillus luteus UH-Slu-Lm8-n1]
MPDDWTPFQNRTEFETAKFFFIENQTPTAQINRLLDLWASTLIKHNDRPPFTDHRDLYKTINNIPVGDVKWESFSAHYTGKRPDIPPPWMDQTFNDFMSGDWAWDQADLIATDPETHGSMFVPVILGSDKTMVSVATGNNEYYPLYASIGNVHNNVWRAHREALTIVGFLAIPKSKYLHSFFLNFLPFHHPPKPGFLSQLHPPTPHLLSFFLNSLAHRHPPTPGFLRDRTIQMSSFMDISTPRANTTPPQLLFELSRMSPSTNTWPPWGSHHSDVKFHGHLLHPPTLHLLSFFLNFLLCCHPTPGFLGDHTIQMSSFKDISAPPAVSPHLLKALVEEATLGNLWDEYGIVGDLVAFTNDYPRADIHGLIAPDLLHQLIKGTFKDHIVDWVEKYLLQTHGKMEANCIMDDIDRRIAATPSFAGLRCFPQGCGFKQWMGDDSKALMKVYLPAIEGHVPTEHYIHLIRLFGAPNGLRSSITKSKHIKAVKEPWQWSNRYKALGQMLVTNQRLDKLTAAWTDFTNRGMLSGTCLTAAINALQEIQIANDQPRNLLPPNAECEVGVWEDGDVGDVEVDTGLTVIQAHVELAKTPQCNCARTVSELALELLIPRLPNMLSHFLFAQLNPNDPRDPSEIPLVTCPQYDERIKIFNSACSRFFAPNDLSGISGMRHEHICACPAWRKEHPRYDCIFVNMNPDLDGMRGMSVARVLTFFSFTYRTETYPSTVVRWFDTLGDSPDEDTGMWVVRPAHHANHAPNISIIHIDSIYRAAHLIPVYGNQFVSLNLRHYQTYDSF